MDSRRGREGCASLLEPTRIPSKVLYSASLYGGLVLYTADVEPSFRSMRPRRLASKRYAIGWLRVPCFTTTGSLTHGPSAPLLVLHAEKGSKPLPSSIAYIWLPTGDEGLPDCSDIKISRLCTV